MTSRSRENELQLHSLLGRRVVAANGRPVGRIEELRAEERRGRLEVVACVLGVGGLLERLGVAVRLLVGAQRHPVVARWDQLDFSDPDRPRLRCPVSQLERT